MVHGAPPLRHRATRERRPLRLARTSTVVAAAVDSIRSTAWPLSQRRPRAWGRHSARFRRPVNRPTRPPRRHLRRSAAPRQAGARRRRGRQRRSPATTRFSVAAVTRGDQDERPPARAQCSAAARADAMAPRGARRRGRRAAGPARRGGRPGPRWPRCRRSERGGEAEQATGKDADQGRAGEKPTRRGRRCRPLPVASPVTSARNRERHGTAPRTCCRGRRGPPWAGRPTSRSRSRRRSTMAATAAAA